MKIIKLLMGSSQRHHSLCLVFLSTFLFLPFLLYFMLASLSIAQEFTAKTLGDYGNVTVMEVRGNYDSLNPDGSTINDVPRREIAKEFFRLHKDEYDFLVIFTNFDFMMPEGDAKAFYLHIRNDTQGIGTNLFDNSSLFGSSGRLQGFIDMGNVDGLAIIPLEAGFEETLNLLAHETMHRWGAYVKFKDALGNLSDGLLHLDPAKHAAHWSFLLDSEGSTLYGNDWQDNGNGTFTSVAVRRYYSPLDLYLMGFYDKSQVPAMLLIDNPDIPRERLPELGVTITGTPQYVTIDDIIAVEGERIPSSAESQKTFKTAFIFITTPGTFGENDISQFHLLGMEDIRTEWMTRFSILTDGRGMMEVASTLKEDIPTNPGITPPQVDPRPLPPNIDEGVAWLMNRQQSDGSWRDSVQTSLRDTAETLLSLKNFAIAGQNYASGIQWLGAADPKNMVYLARKIEALFDAGGDVSAYLAELISGQNPDGGWGSDKSYRSNPVDTSFAVRALATVGQAGMTVSRAIEYLKSKQNGDGGWGREGGRSSVEATTNVLYAFNKYRKNFQVEDQISNGISWLAARQNADGGFGASPSTVYETAMAVSILTELDVHPKKRNDGLSYILRLQSEDGSWYESPYQTAIAVRTVWKATVDPDLSIKTPDIVFTPPNVVSLPASVDINATIWNLGRTSVPEARVVLYDGDPSLGRKLGEQTLAFPGQTSTTATFRVTITDGNAHRFYVWVDPDNLIKESNELNNVAFNILEPEMTYDFEILPSGVSVSPSPADIFHDVTLASTITNKGTMKAYNVQVRYYIDDPGTPFELATATVDIPANSTVTNEITWRASRAGENLPVAVQVDPFNLFTELSETNNRASTPITIRGSTLPDLMLRYQDITINPSPALQGGTATISALVKNDGFSTANNIAVTFYLGVPGVDGVLLGSRTISSLEAGASSAVSVDWTVITESGEEIIYVKVDPDNLVTEIREDDNESFTTLKILSFPDLAVAPGSIAITPPAPKEGDPVQIGVTVENKGEQSTTNILVRVTEGTTVIGSGTIPSIAGKSFGVISFPYGAAAKGPHEISVVVDPDSTITEQRKDNNTASRTFGVQDADLWLTEQYFSPNGDGVKDTTQFFFRLAAPQTVKIMIVDEEGQPVRTYDGPEFADTTAGNITWDGFNDDGRIVPDGDYQVRVVDLTENVLKSLVVVVDNNRSPLAKALGTDYLSENIITLSNDWILYPLNFSDEYWYWFPDERGVLLSRSANSRSSGQTLPFGLLRIAPDGDDTAYLGLEEWSQPRNNKPSQRYSWRPAISPDGEKVAFHLSVYYSVGGNSYYSPGVVWVVDSDGKNLISLDSPAGLPSMSPIWSPDNTYLVYWKQNGLWIVKSDGSGKRNIVPGVPYNKPGNYVYPDQNEIGWSPDGTRIAYIYYYWDGGDYANHKIGIADLSGNLVDIYEAPLGVFSQIRWIQEDWILLTGSSGYTYRWMFIDTSGNGNHRTVYEGRERMGPYIAVSPDKERVAVGGHLAHYTPVYTYIFDVREGTYSHVLNPSVPGCSPERGYHSAWSPDGKKLAFAEGEGGGPAPTPTILSPLIPIRQRKAGFPYTLPGLRNGGLKCRAGWPTALRLSSPNPK